MNYVLTGGAGNISRPLAEQLLKAGHQVKIIGRSAENLRPLTDLGAVAAIGSVEDPAFLKEAFSGADAVYTMVPPIHEVSNWKGHIATIGRYYADAIRSSQVKFVVNLSSVGAHLHEGAGPVSGLYGVEKALNELENVAVLHLRPGYFFNNLLANVEMVRHMDIIGSNFDDSNGKIVFSDPQDIADAAADALLQLNFKGHSVLYLVSDQRTTSDIASQIGQAVGKPQLPWVRFTDEQALDGMLKAGLHEEIARNYAEMGSILHSGKMLADFREHKPLEGKVKLEDFARKFGKIYA
jgi:uncharacterized protein YbjT (DUF2867 family)